MNLYILKQVVSSFFITLFFAQSISSMPMAGNPPQSSPGMPTAAPGMPTTQVSAPQQQMPQAASSSLTSPGATTQIQTTQAHQNSPATQQAAPPSEAQMKEVKDALDGIESTKSALAKLLADLDTKLLDARKQAAEAKSLSFSILEKQQESEAKADYAKISAANKSIQDIQQFAQTEFTKEFNEKITELRVKSTQADSALKAINAQKAAITAAKQLDATKNPQMPSTQPAQEITKSKNDREKDSAGGGIIDSMSSGIASLFSKVTSFFDGSDPAKKKTVIDKLPPMPTDVTQRANQVTAMVQQMDRNLQALDATRSSIQQYITSINQSSQYIETLAKQSEEGSRLLEQSKNNSTKAGQSLWKKTILSLTSKILDGIGYMASGIYDFFDATIGTFTRKLIKDVKRKIATQESTKNTATA